MVNYYIDNKKNKYFFGINLYKADNNLTVNVLLEYKKSKKDIKVENIKIINTANKFLSMHKLDNFEVEFNEEYKNVLKKALEMDSYKFPQVLVLKKITNDFHIIENM